MMLFYEANINSDHKSQNDAQRKRRVFLPFFICLYIYFLLICLDL